MPSDQLLEFVANASGPGRWTQYNTHDPANDVAMQPAYPEKITGLLKAWVGGDVAAHDRLVPLIYNELHRLAGFYRRKAGAGQTMQTTALVHEAYLRLVDIDGVNWRDRAHFFCVAAQLMRRILIDTARASGAAKRGGTAFSEPLDLDQLPSPDSERGVALIALDDALTTLAKQDPRRSQTVELRVFGGLTIEETAEVLGLSAQSAMRDWKVAKAWLLRELSRETGPG
jgi:RNA polymerase sigma factor (TIGR02999 family)